jgi:hypothetical protein
VFRRTALIATILFWLAAFLPATAGAVQQVKLTAGFSPNRLGASTTVRFGFSIASTTTRVPSAVTDVQLELPAGMGLGTTDLGEATCDPAMLFADGPDGCSPNSRMGYGNATVEIPTEFDPAKISAYVTVYMAVPHEEHTTLLLYTETRSPVYSQFVFPSELLQTGGIYGAELHTSLPLIASWPEGPPIAIVHMETTLGPSHLTYYTRRHGKVVAYKPEGMAVPDRCPRGGFPFRASYRFGDGSTAAATTRVPCSLRRAARATLRHR